MAEIKSAGTGNFSAGATWVGGVVPGAGDVAWIDDVHTVTIDTSITVTELRCTNDGGQFYVDTPGLTVTGSITTASTVTGVYITLNLSSGGDFTFIGDLHWASGAIFLSGDHVGTLTITGDVTQDGDGKLAICSTAKIIDTIHITGTVTTGAAAIMPAIYNDVMDIGLVEIHGDVHAGGTSGIAMNGSSKDVKVYGDLYPSAGGCGLTLAGCSNNAIVYGDMEATYMHGITIDGGATNLAVTGTIRGSSVAGSRYGIYIFTDGSLAINGNVYGGGQDYSYGVFGEQVLGDVYLAGNLYGGGPGEGAHGVIIYNPPSSITINANLTGGSGPICCGLYVYIPTLITVHGNITSGSENDAYGLLNNDTTNPVLVDGCLVFGAFDLFPVYKRARIVRSTSNTVTVLDENGDELILAPKGGGGSKKMLDQVFLVPGIGK